MVNLRSICLARHPWANNWALGWANRLIQCSLLKRSLFSPGLPVASPGCLAAWLYSHPNSEICQKKKESSSMLYLYQTSKHCSGKWKTHDESTILRQVVHLLFKPNIPLLFSNMAGSTWLNHSTPHLVPGSHVGLQLGWHPLGGKNCGRSRTVGCGSKIKNQRPSKGHWERLWESCLLYSPVTPYFHVPEGKLLMLQCDPKSFSTSRPGLQRTCVSPQCPLSWLRLPAIQLAVLLDEHAQLLRFLAHADSHLYLWKQTKLSILIPTDLAQSSIIVKHLLPAHITFWGSHGSHLESSAPDHPRIEPKKHRPRLKTNHLHSLAHQMKNGNAQHEERTWLDQFETCWNFLMRTFQVCRCSWHRIPANSIASPGLGISHVSDPRGKAGDQNRPIGQNRSTECKSCNIYRTDQNSPFPIWGPAGFEQPKQKLSLLLARSIASSALRIGFRSLVKGLFLRVGLKPKHWNMNIILKHKTCASSCFLLPTASFCSSLLRPSPQAAT